MVLIGIIYRLRKEEEIVKQRYARISAESAMRALMGERASLAIAE
ncbi:MAG: hypothetical protein ABW189_09260 [Rickettsiales bacterium]